MIALKAHASGVILPVRAHPGARKNELRGEHDGALKVSVTQAPEKGKANRAVVETLARALGLARSQFTLVSGETSHDKKFLVAGVTVEQLAEKIAAA